MIQHNLIRSFLIIFSIIAASSCDRINDLKKTSDEKPTEVPEPPIVDPLPNGTFPDPQSLTADLIRLNDCTAVVAFHSNWHRPFHLNWHGMSTKKAASQRPNFL